MFLPGLNLAYTDRSSMAASTEVRVPFVDPVVVGAAFAVPGRARRSAAGSRRRRSRRRPRRGCPGRSSTGRRRPFSAPLRAWVSNDLRELVDDVLLRGELVGSGFLRPRRRCSGWSTTSAAGRRDYSKQMWQLLTLELWYRARDLRVRPSPPTA